MTSPSPQVGGLDQGGLLVVGESLVDLIGDPESDTFTARAGGSPFNVAIGMARLGQPVTFVTEFGDDHFGQMLAARLRAEGVKVNRLHGTTSMAIATLDTDGRASYDFRFQWKLRSDDAKVRGPFVAVHTGSLSCLVEPGRHAVLATAAEARRQGSVVSFDPNIRPALAPQRSLARDIVEQFVGAATIVKASVEDMEWLFPGENPVRQLHRWAADGDRLLVLTDGPRGCLAVTARDEISVPALPVAIIDTVGAGDSFTAGLLAHLHSNGDLQRVADLSEDRLRTGLEFASRASAVTCAHAGAYHPSLADIDTLPG